MKIETKSLIFLLALFFWPDAHFVYGQESPSLSFMSTYPDSVLLKQEFNVDFIAVMQSRKGSNQSAIKKFTPPFFEDFEIVSGPNRSTSYSSINGALKMISKFSYTLRSKKSGVFNITPAFIEIGDTVLKTKAIQILVLDIKIDTSKREPYLFIKATLSKEKAYIGQRVWIEYKLFTSEDISDCKILNEDEYLCFNHYEERRYTSTVKKEILNGELYSTRVLKRVALFPQFTGSFEISPIEYKLGVRNTKKKNTSFFDKEELLYTNRKSNVCAITVLDFPASAPKDFKGAVDCRSLFMRVKDSLSTKEGIQVELIIESEGDINRVAVPFLGSAGEDELSRIYAISDTISSSGNSISKREIKYHFDSNTIELSDLKPSISYFDTDTEKFKILTVKTDREKIPKFNLSIKDKQVNEFENTFNQRKDTSSNLEEILDLVIVIDVSSSMLAQDFEPDRLSVLKKILINNLANQPDSVRIGIVIFGSDVLAVCPLTFDHEQVKRVINKIETGILNDGTSIGLGITSAINMLKISKTKNKSILLITDGLNNGNSVHPIVAASAARRLGVKIFTMGIGSDELALAPVARKRDGTLIYGMTELSVDQETLVEIANLTGGKFSEFSDQKQFGEMMEELRKNSKLSPSLPNNSIIEVVEEQSNQNFNLWLDAFEIEELKTKLNTIIFK